MLSPCVVFFDGQFLIVLMYSPCVVSYLYFFLMQENHFSLLQRETEKLRGDIEKMRSELRHVLWSTGNVSYFSENLIA